MPKRSPLSLAEVQSAFEAWRQSGRPRITPLELRTQAVNRLADYSLRDVMKALHVDHRRLSRWRRELAKAERALPVGEFVELPPATSEPTVTAGPPAVFMTLTRQAGDGSAVSISAALSEAQWRWALGLLQESVS